MTRHPKLRLRRLREIGWKFWDPIGLEGHPGDEYDTYLMRAAGMLRHDDGIAAAVNYLVKIESEHIGMGVGPTTQSRATATIAAMEADDQLWEE